MSPDAGKRLERSASPHFFTPLSAFLINSATADILSPRWSATTTSQLDSRVRGNDGVL